MARGFRRIHPANRGKKLFCIETAAPAIHPAGLRVQAVCIAL